MRLKKMNGNLLWLVAALFLSGCGYSPEEKTLIYIPASETMEWEVATNAAEQWNACGKKQIILTSDPQTDSIPLTMSDSFLYDDDGNKSGGLTNFNFFNELESIQIYRYDSEDKLLGATLHEFGHVLGGPEHTKSGVMNNDKNQPIIKKLSSEDCNIIN